MSIQIKMEGRRSYILGDTFPVKDQIRAIGAHWDADRRAWWTAKTVEAEVLASTLNKSAPAATQSAPQNGGSNNIPRDGANSVVSGRASYKGKSYYIAGRILRGHTSYDDGVEDVATKDGAKILLYFRDGSSQFWAARAAVVIIKQYDRPQTISGLADFARRAKSGFPGEKTCYMCGSPSCEGAHGGLCEQD